MEYLKMAETKKLSVYKKQYMRHSEFIRLNL